MAKANCPACRTNLELEENVGVGTGLTCDVCGEEWVVSTLKPLRLDYAVDEQIEGPGQSVRSRSRGPFRIDL